MKYKVLADFNYYKKGQIIDIAELDAKGMLANGFVERYVERKVEKKKITKKKTGGDE